jgi:hypothetical protein
MKSARLVTGFLVLAAAVGPVAAIYVPQSRAEFVKAVSDGRGATTVETFSVDRSANEIYGLLNRKASACLDVKVERTAYVGYVEHSSTDYNPTVRRVGGNKVEFSLQVVHNPRAIGERTGPGGLYVMAANIRQTGSRRSEVTLYRSTIGYKKIIGALKAWVSGEDADCPKMR